MANLWIEFTCPEHGLERFKIKIIKKYNVTPTLIEPKFRTRPKHELSGIIIGRNVKYNDIKDYLVHYYNETGLIEKVLSIRLQI
jgi:hypothetical protein